MASVAVLVVAGSAALGIWRPWAASRTPDPSTPRVAYRVESRVVWRVSLGKGGLSSPRAADFNSDGVADVVVGRGFEGQYGAVTALDGRNGETLWSYRVGDEVVNSVPLLDVNGDGVADAFVGGRKLARDGYAVDGRTGETLWTLTTANPAQAFPEINFINFLLIGDQDGDGLRDLLVIQSGGADELRLPARFYVTSSASGRILSTKRAPDRAECYGLPVWTAAAASSDAGEEILFVGTGGETRPGHLFKLRIPAWQEIWRIPPGGTVLPAPHENPPITTGKGLIGSAFLADLDGDGRCEVLTTDMNGCLSCYRADSGEMLWRVADGAYETYASPAPGRFGGSTELDVVAPFSRGVFPTYDQVRLVWADGADGSLLQEKRLSAPVRFCGSSPLVLDLNHDGWDEVVIVVATDSHPLSGTSKNWLLAFDGGPEKHEVLRVEFDGFSSSTPWLGDLDHDGRLDVVHACEHEVVRLEVRAVAAGTACSFPKLKWPEFRGPDGSGVLVTQKW